MELKEVKGQMYRIGLYCPLTPPNSLNPSNPKTL